MKAFAIIRMSGGQPEINPETHPYHGYVLCEQIGNWGAYLICGTGAQLQAIDQLPHVYGICAVTEDGDVKWGELDDIPLAAARDKLNTWLSDHSYPTIPADWTARRIVEEVYTRFSPYFDIDRFDVCEMEAPGTNHRPSAHDDRAVVTEDCSTIIAVLDNDYDPESDPLTVTNLTQPANGAVSLNPDNTVTYTPNPGFTGADSFTYTANDGLLDSNVGDVYVTVKVVPQAVDDAAVTGVDEEVGIDVLGNDIGDGLTVASVTQGSNGSVVNHGNSVNYTPDPGFNGIDSFTYVANDGLLDSNAATVTITVGEQ